MLGLSERLKERLSREGNKIMLITSIAILSVVLAILLFYVTKLHKQITQQHNLVIELNNSNNRDKITHSDELRQLREWANSQIALARNDSRKRSRHAIEGELRETFYPYTQWWQYDNQSDARFIGAPIDFIVFNGLATGNLKEIIFIEIGKETKQLNPHEKQVRDTIQQGKVRWECIKIDMQGDVNGKQQ